MEVQKATGAHYMLVKKYQELFRKEKVKYEMHVNGYSIGQETGERLCGLGFSRDPFLVGRELDQKLRDIDFPFDDLRLQATLRNTPPNHFTFIVHDDPVRRTEVWRKAKEILEGDDKFKGYIESETLVFDRFCYVGNPLLVSSPNLQMLSEQSFRLKAPELMEVPVDKRKACDLHIKRPLARFDDLDKFFLENGFYLVLTPRGNKILTIQAESLRDGKLVYDSLVEYLGPIGGFKKIDLEITGDYCRKPPGFRVAMIARRGSFSY